MARILVIEDNPDNLELMSYLLRAFGHQVSTAMDGEEGVQAVRRERPDLVVSDVHLPRLDGHAVARLLKGDTQLKAIPLVAVTALAMVGDRDKVLASGFDGYIAKPIEPESFIVQVESFLDVAHRGARPPTQETPAPAAAPAVAARARILAVDNEPANLDLVSHILAPLGYEVWLAHSVEEALSLLRTRMPDLILSDLHMPVAGGIDFLHKVQADPRLADLPFVFLSSTVGGDKDRQAGLELGASRFILRPIEPQALVDEIEDCLAEAGGADGGHPGR